MCLFYAFCMILCLLYLIVYLASFSCQFGDRCKFLHVIQQQQKSNIFGFGPQSGSDQQRKSNPYGFGVQNNSQSKGPADFGSKQSQFKVSSHLRSVAVIQMNDLCSCKL